VTKNVLTVLAAVITSCCVCLTISWATQPRIGVAVIDLDEVSKQLGRQATMQQSLQEKAQVAQKALAAIEQDAVTQLQEARRTLGDSPTKEQAQKFQKMQQSATLQFNQLKQKAEQEVSGHRQQLVSQFREQARPVVARVAKEHGFSTVITRNDMFLFSYEQTVDITSEVVQAMLKDSSSTSTAAPAPKSAQANSWPSPSQGNAQQAAAPVKSAVKQVSHEVSQ